MVLSTITSADALTAVIAGVAPGGKLILLGVPDDPFEVSVAALVVQRRSIVGWPSGTGMDSEDTLNFSALTGVKPMIEVYPLERAAEAYDRMMSAKARFRVVLTTGA